ncbi:MAG: hypothetical protein A4E71_01623 [Smithella sp. PtaU1.Bin162]|nr:MAG: hypothetical protein A4E71_01623 [Smithella sp. PtaU1.Bin162]
MMKNKFNIPEKVFRRLVIGLGVVILFLVAGVIPVLSYKSFINEDIKKLKYQIEEQKNLNSVYAMLMKNREKKNFRILSNPAKTTLSRQEANRFQNVFNEMAEKSGLKTISVSPELSSLTGTANSMLNTAVVKGEFVNFRKLLISLGDISYLDGIEEIHIQQQPDALEFRMKILIALGG